MSRVKRGIKARQRRKEILKHAKGHRGGRSRLYKTARESVERGWKYAYRDRKIFKRDIRSLWIVRIGAAAKQLGTSYSTLINSLSKADVALNRKILAEIAVFDPEGFKKIVEFSTT